MPDRFLLLGDPTEGTIFFYKRNHTHWVVKIVEADYKIKKKIKIEFWEGATSLEDIDTDSFKKQTTTLNLGFWKNDFFLDPQRKITANILSKTQPLIRNSEWEWEV